MVKTRRPREGSKLGHPKSTRGKRPRRATFIGTRPRSFTMTLRGVAVDVEVVQAIGTTTHVNFEITISRGGKILDWVPTRPELELIGRAAANHSEQETSH